MPKPATTPKEKFTVCGNAYPLLGWVWRPGRHGGGASAMCVRPMMSALNFWSFCFKTKGRKYNDRTAHRRHDMAAGSLGLPKA